MSSLLALLSQKQPQFQTRQALLVLGLQEDFISPSGKLPVPLGSGFLDRIRELVPAFREHGDVIWVRTEYRENRSVNQPNVNGCDVIVGKHLPGDYEEERARAADRHGDHTLLTGTRSASGRTSQSSRRSVDRGHHATRYRQEETGPTGSQSPLSGVDDEEFLTRTSTKEPCCIPGTPGAAYANAIVDLIEPSKDIQAVKSHYSAFQSTNLLLTLRAKLITEVYICGCNTNLSVYATSMDAARHGLTINIVEDCLGYRQQKRHDESIKQMMELMGAYMTTKDQTLSRIRGEDVDTGGDDSPDSDSLDDRGHRHGDSREHRGPERTTSVRQNPLITPDVRGLFEYLTLREREGRDEFEGAAQPRGSTTQRAESETTGSADEDGNVVRIGARGSHGGSHDGGRVNERDITDKSKNAGIGAATGLASVTPLSAEGSSALEHDGPAHHSSDTQAVDTAPISDSPSPSITQANPPPPTSRLRKHKFKSLSTLPTLGPNDQIGSGDSNITYNFLSPPLSYRIFHDLDIQVPWQHMYHASGAVPRLVCAQGSISSFDGSGPVYRHPSDSSLPLLHWSPAVWKVKKEAEKIVGHRLNHALIQLYRGGNDFISEHSDKTLDIVPNSQIVNVSFGAERTMRLRTKRGTTAGAERETQRIRMPHNSIFVMGLETNRDWLHGIMPDKRRQEERNVEEKAYGSFRISLTFRNIGTFLSNDERLIWGQGAKGKSKAEAGRTINGVESKSETLIRLFGIENQSSAEFDWEKTYGEGSDVLHLKSKLPDKEIPTLFLSGKEQDDMAVRMYLASLGMQADTVEPPAESVDVKEEEDRLSGRGARAIMLRDTDAMHTQVEGVTPILLYLQRHYEELRSGPAARSQVAKELELMLSDLKDRILHDGTALRQLEDGLTIASEHLKEITMDSGRSEEGTTQMWLAGSYFGPADCAFWPVVRQAQARCESFAAHHAQLNDWLQRVSQRKDVDSVLLRATTEHP
ncbi:hypothetical protein M8818_004172 [Zalaria obscura]|uniref:Uncharacterized protein n=1 Tax=Zalaria obscura TaxID=2024903 RepID=A0ACC3SD05_9PEZI